MVPIQEQLRILAQNVEIVHVPGATARNHELKVQLPKDTGVAEQLVTSQPVPADLDLTWQAKAVRFATPNVPDVGTVGGMPIVDLLAVNVTTVTNGQANPPGVGGWLGAITGKVPVVADVVSTTSYPAKIELMWRITLDSGDLASDVNWKLSSGQSGSSGLIIPSAGQVDATLELTLPLVFTELGTNVVERRTVTASARATAGGATSGWVELPPIQLLVPMVPVPTILALFRHVDYGGEALVMVPASSAVADLGSAIDNLNAAIAPFAGAADLALAALPGKLAMLKGNLGGTIVFRKTDEISNLNDIVLKQNPWWKNDIEAEDELSSLMLLAPPGRRVRCCNARNMNTGEGAFEVVAPPELLLEVKSLHAKSPSTNPSGHISILVETDEDHFGDTLSSIRFM